MTRTFFTKRRYNGPIAILVCLNLTDANSNEVVRRSSRPLYSNSLRALWTDSIQMKDCLYINTTLTLGIEYKRRLPKNGLRFTFTRATTKTLIDGRMDIDLTICNEGYGGILSCATVFLSPWIRTKVQRRKDRASLQTIDDPTHVGR